MSAAEAASAAIQAAQYGSTRLEAIRSTVAEEPVSVAMVSDTVDETPALVNEASDDRDTIQQGDQVILVIENDLGFARFLLDTARAQGFKGLVTSMGAAALAMVHQYKPTAITLDIFLPDIDGWRVLSRLKNDMAVRHIPVYVISTEEARERAMLSGAREFIAKPIQSRKVLDDLVSQILAYSEKGARRVLLIEPEADRLEQIRGYIKGIERLEILSARDITQAVQAVRTDSLDCIILNPGTPDLSPALLLGRLPGDPPRANEPVIIAFSDESGAARGNGEWDAMAKQHGLRKVHSLERLLDQLVLSLHENVAALPDHHRQVLGEIYDSAKALAGKKALIVDDDIRNIFALSSVLEEYRMNIVPAENGRDAINLLLGGQSDIDIVLMDIMMPEFDGLDTMREIRKVPACRDLPIVAVTAKAMKGDRQRCIEAGAWDYLSKPVDRDQLLSVLRAWLQR